MSKDREPYVCDGPGCGARRSSDANHWWLIRLVRMVGGSPQIFIEVIPWNMALADEEGTDHGCGIDCMTKLVANQAAKLVLGLKELANGA